MITEDDALKDIELMLDDECRQIPSELGRERRNAGPKIPGTSRKPNLEEYDSR